MCVTHTADERWRSSMQRSCSIHASSCKHARSSCTSQVERPGEHPLYGEALSHGVCFTKSVASPHRTARQGTVISKASVIVGTRPRSRNRA